MNLLFLLYYILFGIYFVCRCLFADNHFEYMYGLMIISSIMSISGFLSKKRFLELLGNGLGCAFAIITILCFNYMNIPYPLENICFLILIMLYLGLRNLFIQGSDMNGVVDNFTFKRVVAMSYLLNSVFIPVVFTIKNEIELAYISALIVSMILAFHYNVRERYISENRVMLFCMLLLGIIIAEMLYFKDFLKSVSSYFLIICGYMTIIGRFIVLESKISKGVK